MKTATSDLAMSYIASIAGTDPNTDISQYEDIYDAFIAGAEAVKSTIPTEQQVKDHIATLPYYGHCTAEWHEGIEDGVKFVKEQLPLPELP
jgi:hypothetical protein